MFFLFSILLVFLVTPCLSAVFPSLIQLLPESISGKRHRVEQADSESLRNALPRNESQWWELGKRPRIFSPVPFNRDNDDFEGLEPLPELEKSSKLFDSNNFFDTLDSLNLVDWPVNGDDIIPEEDYSHVPPKKDWEIDNLVLAAENLEPNSSSFDHFWSEGYIFEASDLGNFDPSQLSSNQLTSSNDQDCIGSGAYGISESSLEQPTQNFTVEEIFGVIDLWPSSSVSIPHIEYLPPVEPSSALSAQQETSIAIRMRPLSTALPNPCKTKAKSSKNPAAPKKTRKSSSKSKKSCTKLNEPTPISLGSPPAPLQLCIEAFYKLTENDLVTWFELWPEFSSEDTKNSLDVWLEMLLPNISTLKIPQFNNGSVPCWDSFVSSLSNVPYQECKSKDVTGFKALALLMFGNSELFLHARVALIVELARRWDTYKYLNFPVKNLLNKLVLPKSKRRLHTFNGIVDDLYVPFIIANAARRVVLILSNTQKITRTALPFDCSNEFETFVNVPPIALVSNPHKAYLGPALVQHIITIKLPSLHEDCFNNPMFFVNLRKKYAILKFIANSK